MAAVTLPGWRPPARISGLWRSAGIRVPVKTLPGAAHFVAAVAIEQAGRPRWRSVVRNPHLGIRAHRHGFEVRQIESSAIVWFFVAVKLQQAQTELRQGGPHRCRFRVHEQADQ
jgi:hypothetical protein